MGAPIFLPSQPLSRLSLPPRDPSLQLSICNVCLFLLTECRRVTRGSPEQGNEQRSPCVVSDQGCQYSFFSRLFLFLLSTFLRKHFLQRCGGVISTLFNRDFTRKSPQSVVGMQSHFYARIKKEYRKKPGQPNKTCQCTRLELNKRIFRQNARQPQKFGHHD